MRVDVLFSRFVLSCDIIYPATYFLSPETPRTLLYGTVCIYIYMICAVITVGKSSNLLLRNHALPVLMPSCAVLL